MFDELEIVALTHDIKEHNLKKGERGTIVDVYGNGVAYEVEFVTPDGSTIALLTLEPEDIRSVDKSADYRFNTKYSSSASAVRDN